MSEEREAVKAADDLWESLKRAIRKEQEHDTTRVAFTQGQYDATRLGLRLVLHAACAIAEKQEKRINALEQRIADQVRFPSVFAHSTAPPCNRIAGRFHAASSSMVEFLSSRKKLGKFDIGYIQIAKTNVLE